MRKLLPKASLLGLILLLNACATVPMASKGESDKAKEFTTPGKAQSGLYIYRDSFMGQALKKNIYVDDKFIGESAPDVFFYKKVKAGKHKVSTESEFGNNDLNITTEGGKNYFIRQYIRMGVFVGQAGLELKSEEEGKKAVSKLEMAISH
ncbi:DUF2846 domain-containing protein [Mannheimia sp. AT1]|uniref:DUF2846 domain-containing protein n=1 Tax=Mannheimia cairinae TaxID=3025936 RepID=A0ABT5MPH2_9PAST|nr:DUF2846 domain-containing protein [Mannheimia cairinae]MDD0823496.1 DUF2846 domain-containing protein [Mannheimia cairinae]MDD0826709.1 DUF2846 domain-containing protein [Mannheimia cairinae]